MKNFGLLILLLNASLLLSACGDSSTDSAFSLQRNSDIELRELIAKNRLNGDPMQGKVLPDIHTPTSQLGRDLFFSKVLSGNRDTACVACHHPMLGGGDNLSLSVGVDANVQDLLGPGRFHTFGSHGYDGGPTVPRNAPTTFNIAAWDKVIFHDGRIEALGENRFRTPDVEFGTVDEDAGINLVHAQARFPITSPEEMKGFNVSFANNDELRYFLAARMGGFDKDIAAVDYPDYWLERFREAFKQYDAKAEELITEQNISFLLSEYQRSQNFTDSPWRAYIEGNNHALSTAAKKGALLFYRNNKAGGANCVSCHTGDFFTDEGFHNIGMPQIGRGKGDGDAGTEDFGRFRETKDENDKFAFRTPTLLNVEVTGPWGHAGAYTSLEAVIRHHLNPSDALNNYDYNQLEQPGIQNLDKLYAHTRRAIDSKNHISDGSKLSRTEIKQLVAFMNSLTDPCTKDRGCMSPWIADDKTDTDPNGNQLNATGL